MWWHYQLDRRDWKKKIPCYIIVEPVKFGNVSLFWPHTYLHIINIHDVIKLKPSEEKRPLPKKEVTPRNWILLTCFYYKNHSAIIRIHFLGNSTPMNAYVSGNNTVICIRGGKVRFRLLTFTFKTHKTKLLPIECFFRLDKTLLRQGSQEC